MGTVFGLDGGRPKVRRKEEASLQVTLMAGLDVLLPTGAFAFAVPNGGYRHPAEGANLKRQGVKAGVPDVILIYLGKAFGLELKSESGSLSTAQKHIFPILRNAGMRIEVARSYGEALSLIKEMGIPLKADLNSPNAIRQVFRDASRRRA